MYDINIVLIKLCCKIYKKKCVFLWEVDNLYFCRFWLNIFILFNNKGCLNVRLYFVFN